MVILVLKIILTQLPFTTTTAIISVLLVRFHNVPFYATHTCTIQKRKYRDRIAFEVNSGENGKFAHIKVIVGIRYTRLLNSSLNAGTSGRESQARLAGPRQGLKHRGEGEQFHGGQ